MKLCYYQGSNFGDELNPYILKHLIPDYKNIYQNDLLFFIGTILNDSFIKKADNYNPTKRKIILGAGVRSIKSPPKTDNTWKIIFVRGPLSSLSLLKNTFSYITDPAYLINKTPISSTLQSGKKYKYSLMPHIFSLNKVNWQTLCTTYGINFIDPSNKDVEYTIQEIAHSEHLITEAMHGAIVADALRVPWKRFKYFSHFSESDIVSEYKWADWIFSMELDHFTHLFYYNKFIREIDKRYHSSIFRSIRTNHIRENIEAAIKDNGYQLSSERLMFEKTEQLLEKVNLLSSSKF